MGTRPVSLSIISSPTFPHISGFFHNFLAHPVAILVYLVEGGDQAVSVFRRRTRCTQDAKARFRQTRRPVIERSTKTVGDEGMERALRSYRAIGRWYLECSGRGSCCWEHQQWAGCSNTHVRSRHLNRPASAPNQCSPTPQTTVPPLKPPLCPMRSGS